MLFKPIDEMSLRHLFSSEYSKNILNIQYLGPIINNTNQIEPSPDCFVIDKRNTNYSIKKCEFKYIPSGINDFKHNGKFDIAIVWDLPNKINRDIFSKSIYQQNNCNEIIVLNDFYKFRKLPDYCIPKTENLVLIDRLYDYLIKREPDVIFSAYLFAKSYPNNINSDKLRGILDKRFPRIRGMARKGKGNITGRFIQMNPPLLNLKYGKNYCWNNDYEHNLSLITMEILLVENFNIDIPFSDILKELS